MMKRIYLERLQNAEHLAFLNDVIALIDDYHKSQIQAIKDTIKPLLVQMEKGLIQIKKSEHTHHLKKMDKIRDGYIKGLWSQVRTEHYAPEPNHQEHAMRLKILLDGYKDISRGNLRKQSELLDNLLSELKSPAYQLSVETLQLNRWIQALEQANSDFITLYNKRRDDEARQEVINVRAVRKDLDKQYQKLFDTINALNVLEPSDELKERIAKINQLIDKWKDTIAIRQGINKKQQQQKDKTTANKKMSVNDSMDNQAIDKSP